MSKITVCDICRGPFSSTLGCLREKRGEKCAPPEKKVNAG